MRVIRKEQLPLIGSSYKFVGADQGDVAISKFLVEALPGRGAPLHCHEYDEVVVMREGQSDREFCGKRIFTLARASNNRT